MTQSEQKHHHEQHGHEAHAAKKIAGELAHHHFKAAHHELNKELHQHPREFHKLLRDINHNLHGKDKVGVVHDKHGTHLDFKGHDIYDMHHGHQHPHKHKHPHSPKLDVPLPPKKPTDSGKPGEAGDPQKGVETPKPGDPQKGTETPKLGDPQKGTETPKPGDPQKGAETPKPGDPQKGTETPKPSDPQNGTETPKPGDPPKGTETPKPGELDSQKIDQLRSEYSAVSAMMGGKKPVTEDGLRQLAKQLEGADQADEKGLGMVRDLIKSWNTKEARQLEKPGGVGQGPGVAHPVWMMTEDSVSPTAHDSPERL